MYNIIQLNDKELSELQSIAKELGIKNAESMKKDELVYGILDEQAIANAQRINARTTYFIHFSHHIGLHADIEPTLPANMHLSYDGLILTI